MNATVRSLLKRGFDTHLAEKLRREGYTLAKLRMLSVERLDTLGVRSACVDALHDRRPTIPEATIFELLYRNAHACCVCRDSTRGVLIHHITPWAESRSHEEENLAVLCPLHHDMAHTSRELTRELTPEQIRHHKTPWQEEVRQTATKRLFAPSSVNVTDGFWDFFNRTRLMDLASTLKIDVRSLPGYASVSVDSQRFLARRFRWEGEMRCGEEDEYSFFKALLRAICDTRDWVDLERIWRRSQMRLLVHPNTLVALTANHRFKSGRKGDRGPGQERTGYYQRKRIRLEFTLDAWECTSSSSYTHHLMGQWICTSLGFVRSVRHSDSCLVVNCSCLAIGTGFTEHDGRIPDVAYTHGRLGEDVADED